MNDSAFIYHAVFIIFFSMPRTQHEMIHASLSINNLCDSHGPNFLKEMNRINAETGANVTVYHYFKNEIALYENRLWRCNGKCRNRPPQFGLIRNKTHDFIDFKKQWWWSYHWKNCGGNFELLHMVESKSCTSN